MKLENSIAILELHKINLQATNTFEEYRDAHVAYVQMLIAGLKGDLMRRAAETAFVEWQPKND